MNPNSEEGVCAAMFKRPEGSIMTTWEFTVNASSEKSDSSRNFPSDVMRIGLLKSCLAEGLIFISNQQKRSTKSINCHFEDLVAATVFAQRLCSTDVSSKHRNNKTETLNEMSLTQPDFHQYDSVSKTAKMCELNVKIIEMLQIRHVLKN